MSNILFAPSLFFKQTRPGFSFYWAGPCCHLCKHCYECTNKSAGSPPCFKMPLSCFSSQTWAFMNKNVADSHTTHPVRLLQKIIWLDEQEIKIKFHHYWRSLAPLTPVHSSTVNATKRLHTVGHCRSEFNLIVGELPVMFTSNNKQTQLPP